MKKAANCLLLFLAGSMCQCTPLPSRPSPRQGSPYDVEVAQLFSGLGKTRPKASPQMPDALLVIAKDATQLTDVVQTEVGTWTIGSRDLILAPASDQSSLGIYGFLKKVGFLRKVTLEPRKGDPGAKPVEAIQVETIGSQDQLHTRWFVALVHKDLSIPKAYRIPYELRIAGIQVTDKTIHVRIEGKLEYEWVDVEVQAEPTFLNVAVATLKSSTPEFWPEHVEVYTNGRRGYPKLPLRIRLGDKFLKEPEPVLDIDARR